MECLVLAEALTQRQETAYQLENLGERWRCQGCADAAQAYALMVTQRVDVAVLTRGAASHELVRLLEERPLLAPPWLLGYGVPAADGLLPDYALLPGWLQRCKQEGILPVLHTRRLREAELLARGMLHALGVLPGLRAWDFLPEMAGLTVVHPPLLTDMTHGLYPVIARRHGMTPGAVERSLRLCVEATWSRGGLAALERFFGSSVDPNRGKPTNREFLCRVQERVTLAAERLNP